MPAYANPVRLKIGFANCNALSSIVCDAGEIAVCEAPRLPWLQTSPAAFCILLLGSFIVAMCQVSWSCRQFSALHRGMRTADGPSQGQLPSEVSQGCTLEAELELVSWKQVSNITDDGLVVKKILQESSDYNTPNAEAKVTVRYTARLEDGTIFDERGEGNELEFLADEGTWSESMSSLQMCRSGLQTAVICSWCQGQPSHVEALCISNMINA